MIYNIPIIYKTGKYHFSKIIGQNKNYILLSHDEEYNILTYKVPKYENKVNIYSIPGKAINETLYAVYDNNGILENIEITYNNKIKLVYIRYADNETAKESIWQFANFYADKISDEILKCKNKVARLFIEYFYDGEAVDFAAKVATVEDMRIVVERYNGDIDSADNCGNYPVENRIECDNETLGIMLKCINPNFKTELFGSMVYVMQNRIKERVLDLINKTDDFKFIVQEYD